MSSTLHTTMPDYFDPQWYLATYPDVAAAGVEPLAHYLNHGQAEGRLPCRLVSREWEDALWARSAPDAEQQLQTLLKQLPVAHPNRLYAAWALARWVASHGHWQEAAGYMALYNAAPSAWPLLPHMGPALLTFTALRECGQTAAADEWLNTVESLHGQRPDFLLAQASLSNPLPLLNTLFTQAGLCAIGSLAPQVTLDSLTAKRGLFTWLPALRRGPKVSVIMPLFNARSSLATALRSLRQQSWKNLEIILVDDASTDGSYALARQLAKKDSRIRLLRHASNQGAYAARNTGLAQATGDLITTHDADDWSHPQKLERQLTALRENPDASASVSHWVRCSPALGFTRWRMEDSWIYRNVSSLMFRREVVERLGYWDRVSVNADTEYYYRIKRAFGEQVIVEVLPGIPLAFGRHDPASLTQAGPTHARTQYAGVRKDYHGAALAWHQGVADVAELYLPARPHWRPFPAPAAICRQEDTAPLQQQMQSSGLLDNDWYLAHYPDVAQAGMAPAQHYLHHGAAEGRDPGPGFSTSGYRLAYPGVGFYQCPLIHYLEQGKAKGYSPLPSLPGRQPLTAGKNVLVVAHAVSATPFGAERSLLDLLDGLAAVGINALVAVPNAGNADYIARLQARSARVLVLPYHWWHSQRPLCAQTREHFANIIRQHRISVVHANTIVLAEPLLAARDCRVTALVHARELPAADEALCQTLGATAENIRRQVLAWATGIVSNSHVVAGYFNLPGKTWVVPNTLDMQQYDMANTLPEDGTIRIGMISSNHPKKGLEDLIAVASLLHKQKVAVRFVVIGPENDWVARWRDKAPANVEFVGYLSNAVEAMGQINILLSLSQFQESFGRTLLEAMAARRPVVCYNWGAAPELVIHEHTGLLAPYKDIEGISRHLAMLCSNPELLLKLGENGRRRALEHFDHRAYRSALAKVYEAVG
ncbi:glycosyltransferase [Zobellella sp. DQSA1]|uniref:glycosyltransferase n=1 Tax=Zobellella sp. DQSA1 TaxID=3342386 RepID=UPI0035C18953